MKTISQGRIPPVLAATTTLLLSLGPSVAVRAELCQTVTPQSLCADAPRGVPQAHCEEIASYLIDFQQTVCGLPLTDAEYYPGYAAESHHANGNNCDRLLQTFAIDSVREELDSYTRLGVSIYRLDVMYPLFTPAFHSFIRSRDPSYPYTENDYIQFYKTVCSEARARGLKVHLEQSSLFPGFSFRDPRPYFESMKVGGPELARERYKQERAAEAYLLLTELQPDSFTILEEPDTQNFNFGLIQGEILYTPQEWQDFLDYTIALFPLHTARLGAGAGTWDNQIYFELFAPMPSLDYVDMHVYPARSTSQDFLHRTLELVDLVRAHDPAKGLTIGESWLYKTTAREITDGLHVTNTVEVLSRDVYSYWQPLDTLFIELLSQLSRTLQFDVLTPYWSRNFYAYLDFAVAAPLSPALRMLLENTAASANLRRGELTATGRLYKSLALQTGILVVSSVEPDHGPQTGELAPQTVTIRGENFTAGVSPVVLLGEVEATNVRVLTTTELIADVPVDVVGTVDLTVAFPDGRSRTKSLAYTYDPPPEITSISPTSGVESGGAAVILSGDRFVPGSTDTWVLFGEVPATEVRVYAKTITARTPSGIGKGSVDVSVRNPDQQWATLRNGYTYVPPPRILAVAPNSGPSAGGTAVSIQGENLWPGSTDTKVWFGAKHASSVNVMSETQIEAVTPAGFGTVGVKVVNPDFQYHELEDAFTYVLPPNIATIVPSSGPEAGGNVVWVLGSSFQSGAAVEFGSHTAPIVLFSANSIKVLAPPGAGEVHIEVINPDGQRGAWDGVYTYMSQRPVPRALW